MHRILLTFLCLIHCQQIFAARQCVDTYDELEYQIRDKLLREELQKMNARELLDLYQSQAMGERLNSVKLLLDGLQPFSQGFNKLSMTEKQAFAVERVKAFSILTELGMKKSQAKKAIDELMGRPNFLEKLRTLVTALDTLIERENGNPWIIRSAGFTALLLLTGPSISSLAIYAKTGYYLPIPFVGNLEAVGVMLVALYGAKGMRIFKNALAKAKTYKLGEPILAEELLSDGKRNWNEVNGELTTKITDLTLQVYDRTKKSYMKHIDPWAGPYTQPLSAKTSEVWSSTMNQKAHLDQLIKSLSLDIILFININKHRSIDELYNDSRKFEPPYMNERRIEDFL